MVERQGLTNRGLRKVRPLNLTLMLVVHCLSDINQHQRMESYKEHLPSLSSERAKQKELYIDSSR